MVLWTLERQARGRYLVDRDLRELVVEFRRVNDRLMTIKHVVGGFTLNVISAYAQVGLDEEIKRSFWDDSDEAVRGHIGSTFGGYDDVHSGFDFVVRNGGETSLLDFAKAFNLIIANSSFPKKEENLVTFQSSAAKTQINYVLFRKSDKSLCMDCKVIPSENLTTHHRLLVIDFEIMRMRRKRALYGLPRIKWGDLTKDRAQELGDKLLAMGAWRNSGDTSSMWTMTANYIREAAKEVLGDSNGPSSGHEGDWWWSSEVQGKVEAEKAPYLKILESMDEEKKRTNRERYKMAKKEAKLAVTAVKTASFE
ncbi:uncharacterized protein LOC142180070 [Nicotiana tabacum]|uniref:Uncharacterized protein LOC142180070 n=1 Tax=Nicotiana tabacum TaxID=4097 RepID=A0AC58UC74_TOBAC